MKTSILSMCMNHRMKPSAFAVMLCAGMLLGLVQNNAAAQAVTFSINTGLAVKPISPLIYGYNAYADGTSAPGLSNQGGLAALQALNLKSRRLGGNSMTPYNWENGASNSGADWCQSSNGGQSYMTGAGWPAVSNGLAYFAPGAGLYQFQTHSVQLGTYSLLQLPAAGMLARDIINLDPPLTCQGQALWQSAAGPSDVDVTRWVAIVNNKPASAGPLTTQPVIGDGAVYIDEELNFLISKFGTSASTNGVKGYELDNEPDLWHRWPDPVDGAGTHTMLHPQLTTVTEVINKNIDLARTVKRMDAQAETFGPALSGYLGQFSLWSVWDGSASHQPTDWSQYQTEPYLTNNTGDVYRYNRMTMVNAYLAAMKAASQQSGQRLLDAFSFHYYAAASSDPTNRVQAARSLWDPSYVEPSWITQVGNGFTQGRGLQMLPIMNQAINDFYPGTKLAITEYDFGGKTDISGAIAQADALGIFGQQGVYLANYFGDVGGYIGSAFKLYRNYDGNKSTFPATGVHAASALPQYGAVYAAQDPADTSHLHIIAINRLSTPLKATMAIASGVTYSSARVWGVTSGNTAVTARTAVSGIRKNTFIYTMPAYSVLHFVLSK